MTTVKRSFNLGRCLAAIVVCGMHLSCADYSSFRLPERFEYQPHNDATELAVVVPAKPGPMADAAFINLGKRIKYIDEVLREKSGDSSLSKEQFTALIEARNLAVAELAEGQEILEHSSGGSFPDEKKTKIDEYLDQIMRGLSSPAGRNIVRTTITFPRIREEISLIFQPYASRNLEDWTTYTPGQLMKVGTYVFRVLNLSDNRECKETVLVLEEPTERKVCGSFKP